MLASLSLSVILKAMGWNYLLLLCRLEGFVMGAGLAYLETAISAGRLTAAPVRATFRWLWLLSGILLTPYILIEYGLAEWELPKLLAKSVFGPFFGFAFLGFSILGYCIFVISPDTNRNAVSRLLNNTALQHLGAISYSTYLLHVPVVLGVVPFLIHEYGMASWVRYPLGLLLSVAISHVTYRAIEWPILHLKKRFAYAQA
jgi:peptidoglycan/LPS O-acetylase OafA/YrhL